MTKSGNVSSNISHSDPTRNNQQDFSRPSSSRSASVSNNPLGITSVTANTDFLFSPQDHYSPIQNSSLSQFSHVTSGAQIFQYNNPYNSYAHHRQLCVQRFNELLSNDHNFMISDYSTNRIEALKCIQTSEGRYLLTNFDRIEELGSGQVKHTSVLLDQNVGSEVTRLLENLTTPMEFAPVPAQTVSVTTPDTMNISDSSQSPALAPPTRSSGKKRAASTTLDIPDHPNIHISSRTKRSEAKVEVPKMLWSMAGNKSLLLQELDAYRKAFVTGLTLPHPRPLLDRFGGTGFLTTYAAQLGALQPGSVLNEGNMHRYICLKKTQQNKSELINTLENYRHEITRRFYLAVNDLPQDISDEMLSSKISELDQTLAQGTLEEKLKMWESDKNRLYSINDNRKFTKALKDLLLADAHNYYPVRKEGADYAIDNPITHNTVANAAIYLISQFNVFSTAPVEFYYRSKTRSSSHETGLSTDNGPYNKMIFDQRFRTARTGQKVDDDQKLAPLKISKVFDKLKQQVEDAHPLLQGTTIQNEDGWAIQGNNHFHVIDPSYWVEKTDPNSTIISYGPKQKPGYEKRKELTIEGLTECFIEHVIPEWKKTQPFLLTNLYHPELAKWFADLGCRVYVAESENAQSTKANVAMREMCVVNYDIDTGQVLAPPNKNVVLTPLRGVADAQPRFTKWSKRMVEGDDNTLDYTPESAKNKRRKKTKIEDSGKSIFKNPPAFKVEVSPLSSWHRTAPAASWQATLTEEVYEGYGEASHAPLPRSFSRPAPFNDQEWAVRMLPPTEYFSGLISSPGTQPFQRLQELIRAEMSQEQRPLVNHVWAETEKLHDEDKIRLRELLFPLGRRTRTS